MGKKARTVVDVLKAARWMIENIGWTQFSDFRDSKGRPIIGESRLQCVSKIRSMCLMGALNLVEKEDIRYYHITSMRKKVERAIQKVCPRWFANTSNTSISNFNDDPDRKKEDILRVLDLAIKDAQR